MEEKYITENNLIELLNNVLYSIKSSEKIHINRFTNKENNLVISTGVIYLDKGTCNYDRSCYSVHIREIIKSRIFKPDKKSYNLRLEFTNIGTKNIEFNSDLVSLKAELIIKNIFNTLDNIETENKKKETNSTIEDIITKISKTVNKSYKRDDKINEVLNNNE